MFNKVVFVVGLFVFCLFFVFFVVIFFGVLMLFVLFVFFIYGGFLFLGFVFVEFVIVGVCVDKVVELGEDRVFWYCDEFVVVGVEFEFFGFVILLIFIDLGVCLRGIVFVVM